MFWCRCASVKKKYGISFYESGKVERKGWGQRWPSVKPGSSSPRRCLPSNLVTSQHSCDVCILVKGYLISHPLWGGVSLLSLPSLFCHRVIPSGLIDIKAAFWYRCLDMKLSVSALGLPICPSRGRGCGVSVQSSLQNKMVTLVRRGWTTLCQRWSLDTRRRFSDGIIFPKGVFFWQSLGIKSRAASKRQRFSREMFSN